MLLNRNLLALAGGALILFGLATVAGAQGPVAKAAVSIPELGLQVTTACDGKTVAFDLVNAGQAWPAVGAIMIVKGDDRTVLSRRNMRLAAGQKASFRLLADRNPGGEIGLFVSPTWKLRDFAFDAKVRCD